MEDPIDVDSMPQEVQDNLVHLKRLGPLADGFIAEVDELLQVLVWSNEQGMETERKIEEIYGEIHFSREQIVASNRVEEEAIVAKKGLEASIESARKKTEEFQLAEAAKKEEVQELYKKIEGIKEEVSKGSGWTEEQIKEKKTLMMNKENVYRNLDNVKSVLRATRSEVERVEGAKEVIMKEVRSG